jgi:hypothetical protein
MSLFSRKALLFSFAAVMICGLLFSTWALGRISAWIVYHDAIWIQMNKEGAGLEHILAEGFFTANGHGVLVIVELLCGLGFLGLLWHVLFRLKPLPKD